MFTHSGGYYYANNNNNQIVFPEKSFLIKGISHFKENCLGIQYDSELTMMFEPNNEYDKDAICIMYNDKQIGYVPKDTIGMEVKEFCKNNIDEPLKIINIKMVSGNASYGIRVIPKCFYKQDVNLENKIFFCG
jgi:hypothetical protein